MAQTNGRFTPTKDQKVGQVKTKTQRKKMEAMPGTRYTSLLELHYYGSITMCVIDPMHNLFLGTANKMFKLWCEKDILTKNKPKCVNIDRGLLNSVIFTDLKAFDTVDHEIILKKLTKYGVDQDAPKWFKSYITNRMQRCNVNNHLYI